MFKLNANLMVTDQIFELIYDTGFYLNILCLIAGFILFRFHKRKDLIILVYLLFSIVFDYLNENVREWFDVDTNYHVNNLWTIVEFFILAIFYLCVKDFKKFKIYQILFAFLFIVLVFIVFISLKSIYEFDNINKIYSALYFSISSIVLYYLFLKDVRVHLLKSSLFWQNTGIFIYFTGNIMVFLTIDYMFSSDFSFTMTGWTIHNVLSIVKTLCFMNGFYKNKGYPDKLRYPRST